MGKKPEGNFCVCKCVCVWKLLVLGSNLMLTVSCSNKREQEFLWIPVLYPTCNKLRNWTGVSSFLNGFHVCMFQGRHSFVFLSDDSDLAHVWCRGVGPRQMDDTWHVRRHCPGGASVLRLVSDGQSSPRWWRGCAVSSSWPHVFLIEPRWSRGSLALISGDRNPIFRGDSWKSGSLSVREMTVFL